MGYAFVGLTILAAIFAVVALDAVDESTESILRERLSLTRTVAQSIDQTIVSSQSLIQSTAQDLKTIPDDQKTLAAHELTILNSLGDSLSHVNSGSPPEAIFLLDNTGDTIWESGDLNLAETTFSEFELLSRGTPSSGEPISETDVGIVVGSQTASEDLMYLGAIILPSQGLLDVSGKSSGGFGEYRMELVDSAGRVVSGRPDEHLSESTLHMSAVGDLVLERQEGVGRHTLDDEDSDGTEHVVAYAPLNSVSWGVVLEQREDTALAVPNNLRRRVILIATGGLLVGLMMAWVTSRQVVRPLARLTRRADAITEGDLTSSIEAGGQDEVRRLAQSFETMRSRLDSSQRELTEWSTELESRVLDRTVQLEQRDHERDLLLGKVISAQEEERRRIARELHDQVGQTLTGLVMRVGGVQSSLPDDQQALKSQLAELGETASASVDEVRRLMSDLRPSILDDMGLESAVRSLVERNIEESGMSADIAIDLSSTEFSTEMEISVYRVFQEALNNVVKHAEATSVKISLSADNQVLVGSVTDDGIGFNSTEVKPSQDGSWAVGLLGMSERVGLLGGDLNIESNVGNGTEVKFEIPLDGSTQLG